MLVSAAAGGNIWKWTHPTSQEFQNFFLCLEKYCYCQMFCRSIKKKKWKFGSVPQKWLSKRGKIIEISSFWQRSYKRESFYSTYNWSRPEIRHSGRGIKNEPNKGRCPRVWGRKKCCRKQVAQEMLLRRPRRLEQELSSRHISTLKLSKELSCFGSLGKEVYVQITIETCSPSLLVMSELGPSSD